jgi:O-antigen ligase
LGRFEVWPQVWNIAWERPWFGFGVGAIHSIVPVLWKNMISIHNDYLRVFYELGIVGFVLTALVCGWQLVALRRQISKRDDDLVRTAFTAGWLGFWAMLVSCATDNTMAYVMYVCPLFILIGAAYGAARAENRVAASAALKERASAMPARVASWHRAAQSH